MAAPSKSRISARKQPKQERSAQLVSAILEAAVQVLTDEGARRFTTARVAERAGVSVGSLYQYFPNKEAILFRLQSDEWRETGAMIRNILEDQSRSPQRRLRDMVTAFIRSECEEAAVRIALGDAAPLYRDAPEAKEPRMAGTRTLILFMRELLPAASDAQRMLAADIMAMSLAAVGKRVSEDGRSAEAVEAASCATADMFCAYLESVAAVGAERDPC
jgi:AcrR family transcriptional regulator